MPTDLTTAIIRILNQTGQTVGTGFVLSDTLAVTCAHVVESAGSGPGQPLACRFHLADTEFSALVEPQGWRDAAAEDIALLRLTNPLPPGVTLLPLGSGRAATGHAFRAFGFAEMGTMQGVWATGQVKGLVQDERGLAWLQLASPELTHGISGGPIWDESQQRVVGLLSAAYFPNASTKHRDTAFATPVETLRAVWPALPPPQTIENPFFTGGRINDPRHFFGRERLLRELRSELKKRSSISLVGESQVGKSSLLWRLYHTRANWLPGVTVRYIDLQGVLDEADFCETVLAQLDEAGDSLHHLKRVLARREVVLLFDEVERLAEPDFNPRLHDLLRSLAQEPHFALALATQRPLVELFPARAPGGVSPFHNIFATKTMPPFTQAQAHAFVESRLAPTGITFTDADLADLWAHSQGHPATLQRRAKALFTEKIRQ